MVIRPYKTGKVETGKRTPSSGSKRLFFGVFTGVAAFYAFGLPMLGLIDVGSCAMFANLKAHGGSNHLFLPTGLLQRWFAGAAPDGSSCAMPLSFLAAERIQD